MKYKILLVFSVVVFLLSGCVAETEFLSEEKLPDDKISAILYRKNAGATTAYGYHVDIIKERKVFKDIEINVFRASNTTHISVDWKSKNKLLIFVMGNETIIYFQEEEVKIGNNIIKIEYNIQE